MSGNPVPVEIKQSGVRELRIIWDDSQVNDFDVVELRRSCRCASCVDEITGSQILQPSQVGEDVRPQTIRQVGNYAIQINWTDGHTSGIFTFDYLRQLAQGQVVPPPRGGGGDAGIRLEGNQAKPHGKQGGGCGDSSCGCGS